MKPAVISASGIALYGSEQCKNAQGHVSRPACVKALVARNLDKLPTFMPSTCAESPLILIADDQPDLIDALKLLLKGQGIETDAVTSPDAAIAALETRPFDLLLMDLNYTGDTTSGREGIDLLSRVQEIDRLMPIVVMTGWGSVDLAVEAMRRGVRDFVQ